MKVYYPVAKIQYLWWDMACYSVTYGVAVVVLEAIVSVFVVFPQGVQKAERTLVPSIWLVINSAKLFRIPHRMVSLVEPLYIYTYNLEYAVVVVDDEPRSDFRSLLSVFVLVSTKTITPFCDGFCSTSTPNLGISSTKI